MKKLLLALMATMFLLSCQTTEKKQRNTDFNFDWKFSLEVDSEAHNTNYNDSQWRTVNLPHDWSVEFPFDTIKGEGCTGYLPGGTGWYRKHFNIDFTDNELVSILFDGVYNHSDIWINGHHLGYHPYGYTPFHYDLTPYLNKNGKNNVIAVKVDRTRFADSRWYTGSGIYRNVEIIKTNKLHIPIWGTFVTTPEANVKEATVNIDITISNQYTETQNCQLETKVLAPDGSLVASKTTDINIEASATNPTSQTLSVSNPSLWSIEKPTLFTAITTILNNGSVVDTYETTFGIRTIEFDADKGFFLNGTNMKIKGVCLHHDAGLVGAAVPKEVWRQRLQTLKDGGCNAIRISHNPASDEFLDLCDEMGFLVQDEFFDEWDYPKDKRLNMNQQISTDYITEGSDKYFQEWAERDLKTTVIAHRNHPSIIQWSIGNEIEWTYPRNKKACGFWDADWSGNYFWSPTPLKPEQIKKRYEELEALDHSIGETAQKLSKWTKELDTTRPVIANCILPSASYVTGYADALDIIGFSYRRVMYDYGHLHFPDKPLMGTENLAQWHEWKAIMERPFVSGTFLWTGTDYMGEAHQRNKGDIRRRGTLSGLLDFAGFEKPSFYMMKSLWNEDEATLYLSTQILEKSKYKLNKNGDVIEKKAGQWKNALWEWHAVNEHWNYQDNEDIVVEIISNCPEVELFLNNTSLGIKKLSDFEDQLYKWHVPFKAGKLEAKAVYRNKAISSSIQTAIKPVQLQIMSNKSSLIADGYDVSHITVQLIDEHGTPVKHTEEEVQFSIEGDVTALGVDNGNGYSLQTYQSDKVVTSNGRALLIVQSNKKGKRAKVSASFKNSPVASIELLLNN
ncbi:DUF4982 domain-containing protein [Carboxylicivirga sediminis]|uniref:DUF4982 domain-containing protein n=1 Tax=Carboxylicivirga sediminis TaxID=2006564 RepID=A0A941F0B2_9BACT|nr:glycoside hydrolase family 2 TIM barrel-domain containing protein [Carboxylicivirga sediminis]MBR8534019.1 DUF4982 domain-containing protein [Carboxylicivirga sediminis]